MKKLFLILFLTFVVFKNSNAQDKKPVATSDHGVVSICFGASFPNGDFASVDGNNQKAGFATTGGVFDLAFGYKLGKYIGIGGCLRGQSNKMDEAQLRLAFENAVPGANFTLTTTYWSTGAFLFGGYGSWPVSSKVNFDAKLFIGLVNATSPEIKIIMGGDYITQNSKTGTSAGFLLGGGFRFDVGTKVCLLTNLDLLTANPQFKNVETVSSVSSMQISSFNQPITTLNLSFGVGIKI